MGDVFHWNIAPIGLAGVAGQERQVIDQQQDAAPRAVGEARATTDVGLTVNDGHTRYLVHHFVHFRGVGILDQGRLHHINRNRRFADRGLKTRSRLGDNFEDVHLLLKVKINRFGSAALQGHRAGNGLVAHVGDHQLISASGNRYRIGPFYKVRAGTRHKFTVAVVDTHFGPQHGLVQCRINDHTFDGSLSQCRRGQAPNYQKPQNME